MGRGEEERRQIGATKTAVRRAYCQNRIRFEHAAFRREHVDQRARARHFPPRGGNDISFRIEAHAIDAAMHTLRVVAPGKQRRIVAETAVAEYRIRAQLAVDAFRIAAFCDIERRLICRHENPVGPCRVEGDACDGVTAIGLRIAAVHRLVVEVHLLGFVHVAFIPRIGEPDATFTVDCEIVGRVEFLPSTRSAIVTVRPLGSKRTMERPPEQQPNNRPCAS